MTHTDMTQPFSTNPKLADWVPSEQQIQTITAALPPLGPRPRGGRGRNEQVLHQPPERVFPHAPRDHRCPATGRRRREVVAESRRVPQAAGGRGVMARQTTAPRFLRLPEVLNLVGVTRSTLYRWMEAGTFPKQISVGGNTVVWVESAVTAWMEDQMASR